MNSNDKWSFGFGMYSKTWRFSIVHGCDWPTSRVRVVLSDLRINDARFRPLVT